MDAEQIKNFCKNSKDLALLWEYLGRAAAAFRPHWHCAGLRHHQKLAMSAEEAAGYETAKEDFEKKSLALSQVLKASVPGFAMPDNIGEIAEAYSSTF
jgi:hypothetical protein